jgi:hypothetical protein
MIVLVTGCGTSEGPEWRSYDVSGHKFAVRLPAPPDTTETIIVEGRDPLVGYRISDRETFGSVEIKSTPPVLLSPDVVHDYRHETLADGELFSWWLPSNGMAEDRSYAVYYRRSIDGVAVTCGYDYIPPTQVDAVKASCASLRAFE